MSSKELKSGNKAESSVKDSTIESQDTDKTTARRSLLKKLAIGGVAGAAMPSQWSKPVIDAVVLPAHAQTSGVIVGGGGGGGGVGGPGPAPENTLGDELLDLLVNPASANVSVKDYCLEIKVTQEAGTPTDVSVTKLCYNLCAPGKYMDRLITETVLTGSGSNWTGTVDGLTLNLTNVNTSAATLADAVYDGVNGTILNGGSCNCGDCGYPSR